jgi:hypothetical protein
MATTPVINYRRYFDSYELNISARKLDSNPPDIYAELIVRTVKLWLYLAKAIQNNLTTLPDEIAFRSVEQSIEEDSQDDTDTNVSFDGFDENRVTIFDWSHSQGDKFKLNMTLHSNSLPQAVLDLYWAMHSAKQTLETLYPTAQNQSTKPSNSSATPTQASTTSKPPETAQNTPLYTKKDAIAKLPPGSPFKWRVAQIEKHSKDGKDFYEFFEFWGGKAGQYAGSSVFTDNEIAINSGLIAYLDSLGIKAGQALTGDWITNATVGKPKTKTVKGEEKTFTNIYVQSFEGQPEKV